ncbi:MoaD/ThiS family protein [Prosthecobacter sp.]|jgi:molybdopterin converting factor small subunit|uniref:MoaD/ThiS family protein n=1 Tax=Prosthecobacter sp. TaxID=1965333 RepID=UPI003783B314
MKLRVLFFSVLRDITGADEITIELPVGSSMADLLAEMETRWPKLRDWAPSMLLALDQTYVKRDATLHDGAEIALMPPVQGG